MGSVFAPLWFLMRNSVSFGELLIWGLILLSSLQRKKSPRVVLRME